MIVAAIKDWYYVLDNFSTVEDKPVYVPIRVFAELGQAEDYVALNDVVDITETGEEQPSVSI